MKLLEISNDEAIRLTYIRQITKVLSGMSYDDFANHFEKTLFDELGVDFASIDNPTFAIKNVDVSLLGVAPQFSKTPRCVMYAIEIWGNGLPQNLEELIKVCDENGIDDEDILRAEFQINITKLPPRSALLDDDVLLDWLVPVPNINGEVCIADYESVGNLKDSL